MLFMACGVMAPAELIVGTSLDIIAGERFTSHGDDYCSCPSLCEVPARVTLLTSCSRWGQGHSIYHLNTDSLTLPNISPWILLFFHSSLFRANIVALWVWKHDFYLGIGLRIIRSSVESSLNSDSTHLKPMISPDYLLWLCTPATDVDLYENHLYFFFFCNFCPLFAALNKLLCCSHGNCTFWTCFRCICASWESVTWQLYRDFFLCHQIVSSVPISDAGVMNFRFSNSRK